MRKVKNVWFTENRELLGSDYATGLVIELEDGRVLAQQSTDMVRPFDELEHNTKDKHCWCNPRIIKVKGKKKDKKFKWIEGKELKKVEKAIKEGFEASKKFMRVKFVTK